MTRLARALAALAPLTVAAPAAPADPVPTMIVMDGSGSMWGQIDGRPKLEIARETLTRVLGALPASLELGLIAYGHREKGVCSDIELMVPPRPGAGPDIAARVGAMRFLGKTPLTQAVREAAATLRSTETPATVVLITDGLETCDADPCALARELEAAGLGFTAQVIGFGLTAAEGAQVACLATETGGQYLQAADAGDLAAALAAAVTDDLPPPRPLPVPDPEPVLPQASLSAPASAPAGSTLEVGFTGPHEELDTIRLLDPAGEGQAEAPVGPDPRVTLRLPFQTGPYELVYLHRGTAIIARAPLTVTPAEVGLIAPDSAPAGAQISVTWSGPAAEYDHVVLLDADGARVAEVALGADNPLALRLPFRTGACTLGYWFDGRELIATRPITLTDAPVSLTAPATAPAGSDLRVAWVGPNAAYDTIQLVRAADGERLAYAYLGDTNEVSLTLPDTPGAYELYYKFQDTEVIHRQPITVTTP